MLKRHSHFFCNLIRGGVSPNLLNQKASDSIQFIDDLDHVDRKAYGTGLISDRPRDGLPNPPRRIRTKLVTTLVFELIYRPHQAHIPFLDSIHELEPAIHVSLG